MKPYYEVWPFLFIIIMIIYYALAIDLWIKREIFHLALRGQSYNQTATKTRTSC